MYEEIELQICSEMVTCMNEVFANKYLCDAHCPVCLTLGAFTYV